MNSKARTMREGADAAKRLAQFPAYDGEVSEALVKLSSLMNTTSTYLVDDPENSVLLKSDKLIFEISELLIKAVHCDS